MAYTFIYIASFEKSNSIANKTIESNIPIQYEGKGKLAHSGTNADLTFMNQQSYSSQILNDEKPIIKVNNETIGDLTDFIGGSGFVSNNNINTRHAFGDT